MIDNEPLKIVGRIPTDYRDAIRSKDVIVCPYCLDRAPIGTKSDLQGDGIIECHGCANQLTLLTAEDQATLFYDFSVWERCEVNRWLERKKREIKILDS